MIQNRLAELMAQRKLKITQVAKETGISRNTISATAQNDGSMIKLETIDKLCNYLGVTPAEFFNYIPVEYSIDIENEDINISGNKNSLLTLSDISYKLECTLTITYKKKISYFSLVYDYNTKSDSYIIKGVFEDKDDEELFGFIKKDINNFFFFENSLDSDLRSLITQTFLNKIDEGLKDVASEYANADTLLTDIVENFNELENIENPDSIFLPF